MPITEVVLCPLVPGSDICGSHESAAAALRDTVDGLRRCSGCQHFIAGMQLENVDMLEALVQYVALNIDDGGHGDARELTTPIWQHGSRWRSITILGRRLITAPSWPILSSCVLGHLRRIMSISDHSQLLSEQQRRPSRKLRPSSSKEQLQRLSWTASLDFVRY